MKKIAIFTYSIYTLGGEQRVVSLLANELSKNHDVTIFTMDADDKNDNLFGLSDKISVRRYHPYKHDAVSLAYRAATHLIPWLVYDIFPKMLERAYCADKYARLMNELITDGYDTVIVTAWQLSIILGKVKQKYNRSFKAIAWEHSSYDAYFERKYFYLYKNEKLFKKYLQKVDEIVVLNEIYKNEYKKKLGLDCTVIYNPKTYVSYQKSQLNSNTILACSRIDENKGIDLLLEAFMIFKKCHTEWKLIIAGDGPSLDTYKSLASKYGLTDSVEFLGRISNVSERMLDASIFALPSRFEGFPMSVTEAFESGVPVVAFDIPAMIPFVNAGGAVVAKAFDVEEYANILGELAESISRRQELAVRGIEFARCLDIAEISKVWENINV